MSDRLVLTILSAKGLVFEGEVDECYVPTNVGPVGILRGHTPYIASIKKIGVLKFASRSVKSFYVIKQGAVEVKGERLLVITTEAIKANSLQDCEKMIEDFEKEEH